MGTKRIRIKTHNWELFSQVLDGFILLEKSLILIVENLSELIEDTSKISNNFTDSRKKFTDKIGYCREESGKNILKIIE